MDPLELKRELEWWLQNRLTLSAPVFNRAASLHDLALDEAGRARLQELGERYDLAPWGGCCGRGELIHSLYALDLLDRHLGAAGEGPGLDIGSGPWGYLPGLAAWGGGPWEGGEIDAHRRYLTGVTRRGYGRWMARRFPRCRYLAGSLTEVSGGYQTITWLLPLVTEGRLAAHRLPRRLFQPLELLRHAWGLLAPGGRMLVLNQEEGERIAQERLFLSAEISVRPPREGVSPLAGYRHPRYVWVVEKHAEKG